MPHSPPTLAMLLEIYRQHKTPFDIVLFLLAGVFVRLFYWGGKFRETCGDLIVGLSLMCFIYARVPGFTINIPVVGDVTLSHAEIAFVFGILGYKGFKELAFYILKKKFGIDIRARQFERNSTS